MNSMEYNLGICWQKYELYSHHPCLYHHIRLFACGEVAKNHKNHQPYPVEEINNAVLFGIPVCYNRSLPIVPVEAKRVLLKHQCILNYYGFAK